MEETAENFLREFHNLKGITIGEKRRNLFQLFNTNSQLSENRPLLDLITSKLSPQTNLENLFLVEFFIYFRRFEDLHREFLKGNEIVVSKISKENWFFQRAFQEIGTDFVNQVLPTMGYSLRLKTLKKIVPILTEEQGDAIFDALLERYGIFIAANILTCCSVDKIEHILKNYYIKLWTNQLKILYNKNSKLIYIYLEEREKHEGNRKFMDSDPIFEYVASRNIDMYYDLYKKYEFKNKLGKRITQKIIAAKRKEIIDQPETYVKHLNPARLVRKLGQDFKQIFIKMFPKKIQDSPKSESMRLLAFYPKKGRYNLLVSTFNQVFEKKLDQCPYLIDDYLSRMIVDGDERERMAKIKAGNDDTHIIYYRTDHCIAAVKEKLKFARTPFERGHIIADFVETCLINDDYDALLEVCKFVSERFKNDITQSHINFLQRLVSKACRFREFTGDHWIEIKKIMASTTFTTYYEGTFKGIFLKYVEFLVKTDGPLQEEILHFFKKAQFHADDLKQINDPRAKQLFLLNLIELAPRLVSPSNIIEKIDLQLILACKNYNFRNLKNVIEVWNHPRLVQSMKTILIDSIDVENKSLSLALQCLVCVKERNEEIKQLTELYFMNFEKYCTRFAAKWFLRHRPELIKQHLEEFLCSYKTQKDLNKDKKIWRTLKNYEDLRKQSVNFFINKINDENDKKPHFALRPLSYIIRPREFLKLAEHNKPEIFKIDRQDVETNRKFLIQRYILKGLVNINGSVNTLPLILQCFKEDYVSSCLSALYSAFYKLPESQTQHFVDEICGREAISVKKHGFYLTCTLCSEEKVVNVVQSCRLRQSVAVTFKYFLKNESEKTWSIFEKTLTHLDKNDEATLTLLLNKTVPIKYRSRYIEILWEIVNLHNLKKQKNELLILIENSTVTDLRKEFFVKMINTELFSKENMYKIVSLYLIESPIQEKLEIVFNALKKYKTSQQYRRRKIYDFISAFFSIYINHKISNECLIEKMFIMFQQIFPLNAAFEENVMFSVMKLKKEPLHDFTKSIIKLHNDLILKYGQTTVNIFANILSKLLPQFFKNNLQLYEFYYLLLQYKQCTEDMLLIIKLLPTDFKPEDKDSFNFYNCTLSQLQEANLPNIQLHLNLHFKFHKTILGEYYLPTNSSWAIITSSWLQYGAQKRCLYYSF